MVTKQVHLSERAVDALEELARQRGKTADELLEELVQSLVGGAPEALHAGRAIWKDRDDLPDFAALRREWDRA